MAGYHSEYSGMKFGMFFVGEYMGITLISAMISVLFFGGWLGPVLPGRGLVSDQDLLLHFVLRSAAGGFASPAIRSTHVLGLESDVAPGSGQRAAGRRGGPIVEVVNV